MRETSMEMEVSVLELGGVILAQLESGASGKTYR